MPCLQTSAVVLRITRGKLLTPIEIKTMFPVSPAKEKTLHEKMRRFAVRESDLRESFIRSGGPGGQHVNKVATGVYLKHIPTGIEVKYTQARSQAFNRFMARRILVDKIADRVLGRQSEERARREKIRRQKRRRSRRSKEKMLFEKKCRSEKKSLRRSVAADR